MGSVLLDQDGCRPRSHETAAGGGGGADRFALEIADAFEDDVGDQRAACGHGDLGDVLKVALRTREHPHTAGRPESYPLCVVVALGAVVMNVAGEGRVMAVAERRGDAFPSGMVTLPQGKVHTKESPAHVGVVREDLLDVGQLGLTDQGALTADPV